MVPTDDISDLLAIGLTSVAGAITGRRTGPFQICTVATESSQCIIEARRVGTLAYSAEG